MSEVSLPVTVSFDGLPEPVLLLDRGQIRYCNPSARAQLPGVEPGAPLPPVLGELPQEGSTHIWLRGASWTAVTWPYGRRTLVRLLRISEHGLMPDHRLPVLVQKLRVPLTALVSSSGLLEQLLTPEQLAEGGDYLARSTRAQMRLLRLMHNLELATLDPSNPPYDVRFIPTDLKGLFHEACRYLEGLSDDLRCTISVQETPGNYLVLCDDNLLMILLYNLVANAARACYPKGNLTLRLEPSGRSVLLSVEDDGPGLTELELAQLFDPTRGGDTLATAGAGLGLGVTICRKIAMLHEGSLFFTNRKPHGLRATLSLPRYTEHRDPILRSPSPVDSTNGVPLVLRELSDVLPARSFRPEDLE